MSTVIFMPQALRGIVDQAIAVGFLLTFSITLNVNAQAIAFSWF
jgi:hypothetical protein